MSSGHPPHDAPLPAPTLEEVSPGIFAYVQLDGSWFLNNAGFVVGARSAVAIDTLGTERRSRQFLEALRATTPNPIQALVNTHAHADHTHGNYLVAPATAIIAHEACREEMKRASLPALQRSFPTADFGDVRYEPPMVTFRDRIDVFVDDLRIELIHIGPAHTTSDVIAWIPERKVLFSGDLVFNGGTPFAMAGSVEGWLEAIPFLRSLGAETVVPGHGSVCTPAVLDTVEAYLRFVLDLARRAVRDGIPPLELARTTDLGPFADLLDQERLVGNLHRAVSELTGNVRGGPIGVPTVFAEMVEYNGGKPLRCLA